MTVTAPIVPAESTTESGPRMRLGVAMLIHRFHPHVGGAETQLKALAPHLTERGIDVRVITRSEPGAPSREVIDTARVTRAPIPEGRGAASLSYSYHALSYLRRHRREIQLIHAHGLLSPSTTAVLGHYLLRLPVVVTTHGFQADLSLLRDGLFGAQRFQAIGHAVDRFVVISDEIRSGLIAQGVDPAKLVSIRNGIDTDHYVEADPETRRQLREQLGVSDRKVVVYVGRLEDVKGPDILLDAWPAVLREVSDAELLIAGDGSIRAALERRAMPSVRFLGSCSDPLSLYQAADCYVLPSRSEGLPVALLEALSVGVPAVSTSVGGATEILRGYDAESLVQPDDPGELAGCLVSRLQRGQSPVERATLSERVRLSYSIESTADQLAGLYRSLVPSRAAQ